MSAEKKVSIDSPEVIKLCTALQPLTSHLVTLYKSWDSNNDGRVSKAEFHKGIGELKLDAPRSAVETLFKFCDTNHSGYIEYDEIDILIKKAIYRPKDATVQTDLTAQQLQAYMEAAEQWRTKAIQAEQDASRARAALVTAESSQRVSPT